MLQKCRQSSYNKHEDFDDSGYFLIQVGGY